MKRTLSLLIILVVIVGLIVLVNSNKRSKTKAGYQPLAGITLDGVKSIKITRANEVNELVKEGGKWLSLTPEKYPADAEKIKRAIDYLGKQNLRSPVSKNPANYKKFKVDSAGRTRVEIKGKKNVVFDLGGMNKGYGGNFLKMDGEAEVYVTIEGALFHYSANKNYYRDKTFIRANKDSVSYINISWTGDDGNPASIEADYNKTENTWSLNGQKIGDPSKINGLIGEIVTLRCNDWYNKEEDNKTGFDKPYMTIQIKMEDGKEILAILGAESSSKLYAKNSSDNVRYFINKYEADRLKKKESDLEGQAPPEPEKENVNIEAPADDNNEHEGHNH